jgi:hypothetical protein
MPLGGEIVQKGTADVCGFHIAIVAIVPPPAQGGNKGRRKWKDGAGFCNHCHSSKNIFIKNSIDSIYLIDY